jgi:hypothetical protein
MPLIMPNLFILMIWGEGQEYKVPQLLNALKTNTIQAVPRNKHTPSRLQSQTVNVV